MPRPRGNFLDFRYHTHALLQIFWRKWDSTATLDAYMLTCIDPESSVRVYWPDPVNEWSPWAGRYSCDGIEGDGVVGLDDLTRIRGSLNSRCTHIIP